MAASSSNGVFDITSICELIADSDGWGPSAAMTPERFTEIPFAPFGKNDRLGRVSDIGNVLLSSRFNKRTFAHVAQASGRSRRPQVCRLECIWRG